MEWNKNGHSKINKIFELFNFNLIIGRVYSFFFSLFRFMRKQRTVSERGVISPPSQRAHIPRSVQLTEFVETVYEQFSFAGKSSNRIETVAAPTTIIIMTHEHWTKINKNAQQTNKSHNRFRRVQTPAPWVNFIEWYQRQVHRIVNPICLKRCENFCSRAVKNGKESVKSLSRHEPMKWSAVQNSEQLKCFVVSIETRGPVRVGNIRLNSNCHALRVKKKKKNGVKLQSKKPNERDSINGSREQKKKTKSNFVIKVN